MGQVQERYFCPLGEAATTSNLHTESRPMEKTRQVAAATQRKQARGNLHVNGRFSWDTSFHQKGLPAPKAGPDKGSGLNPKKET